MKCPFHKGQKVLVSSSGIFNPGGTTRPDDKWHPGLIEVADNGAGQSWVFFDGGFTPMYVFWGHIKPQ